MPGPAVREPAEAALARQSFGTVTSTDAPTMLKVMEIIHREPLASEFAKLVTGQLRPDQGIGLAHFFEELGAMALHRLVSEEIIFDAFAVDQYWDRLEPAVASIREKQDNPKFGENFEILANAARSYRETRPPKRL